MSVRSISWTLYIVGSLLVFGSWIDIVPTGLAWIGWCAAIAGWFVGNVVDVRRPRTNFQPQQRSTADEIAKLDLLRKEGVISEEDFQEAKSQVIRKQ